MAATLDVPELVRRRAMTTEPWRRWLDELPDVVEALADRWGLDLGRSFGSGTASFVAEVVDRSGRACVLKVAMPPETEGDDLFGRSVLVHRLAGGRGCAELLDADEATLAMVLERLGPNLDDLGMPVPAILEAVTATLRSFWRPLPPGTELPTGADQAMWLAAFITRSWEDLGRPCAREVVDRAVAYCDLRAAAFEPATAVLVHGDAHGWNTLDAGDGVFKFVDPEGLVSEPAHDLGVPMREYNEPLLAGDTPRLVRRRAERLAASCDVDPEAVWQWGFIERVSTGLAGVRDFGGVLGLDFLEVARRCL